MGFYERLGTQISAARAKLGITQAQLSSGIGLTRSSVANIEAGKQRISVEVLAKIAQALGLEPATLIPPLDSDVAQLVRDDMRTSLIEVSEGLIDQVEKYLPRPRGDGDEGTNRKGGRRSTSATRD